MAQPALTPGPTRAPGSTWIVLLAIIGICLVLAELGRNVATEFYHAAPPRAVDIAYQGRP